MVLTKFAFYLIFPIFFINFFFKTSLELASHCFEVRILVYSISDENYLNSTIYNKRFEKTISLLKTGTHFDVAVEKPKFEIMSFAQNLVYEVNFLFGHLLLK